MTLHDRRPRAPLFQPLPAALRRALSWRLGFVAAALACVLLLALLSEARAAGGAYRVDDGEIDPVGECNLDAWHQRERHHGNRYQCLGHAYAEGERRHRWNWGVGMEYRVGQPLTLIAERFGESAGDSGWQAGPRLHLGERLDLDLLVGGHLRGERERWLVSGATLRF